MGPPVRLARPFRDAEPEPGAAVFRGDRGVDLTKLGEDVLALVRGNADAGIADAIHEPLAVETHLDVDPALARELQRVAGEVHEALRDAPAVAPGRRDVGRHPRGERQALLEGPRFQGRGDDPDDFLPRA